MLRKTLIIILHMLFWTLSYYFITRVFGVSTVEIIEEEINGLEEKVLITFDHRFTLATAITVGLCALVFYTNIFAFLKTYFQDKKTRSYLLKLGVTIFLAMGLSIILNKYVNYYDDPRKEVFLFPSFGLHMALFVFYTVISFAYAFTLEWFKNEKLRNQITQEKLKTELNFLKAQINPHFLFNTLNNLFSISQKHKIDELSTGISELSNLMRYMLYESNSSFVSLKKEVDYIESFIEIQKLRYDENDFIINFDKKGNLNQVAVAPMILLPFVENAFKHGFSMDQSSIINMMVDASDGNIRFKVVNKTFNNKGGSESASGIGLENVKRRLDLIYPKNHTLDISETADRFTVALNIKTDG
ncbi:sensor histidine kinase [Arenibacter amylolyticus]|uniref:sensor histidine kinase n=1 Tax=Arenibacter amylolyticus TaxID=1406873 RepID=UPI00159393F6|nr:histidine kinase [Arenibacter amylolyticus]